MDAYLPPFWPVAVVLALILSAVGVGWLVRDRLTIRARLQERFLLGIPWGSILVLAFVVGIYLFVQDGVTNFERPVYLPFVNWSYLYPTGVVLGPFTHGSAAHLLGNLTTAAVLAPIAEYAWGHHTDEPMERPWQRPVVRACIVFPAAILGVGLVTSLFTWGPVIGFSGVVYALAGFTVVRYPVVTIVALLGRSAMRELGDAVIDPVVEATTGVAMTTPSWVGISFQGHAIGFFVGALLGVALLHRRKRHVPPTRMWLGLVLVMIGMGLWSIWGTRGENVYVLYRGLGFVLLFVAALIITVAAVASDRSLVGPLTRRQASVLLVAIPILILAGIAMPLNLLAVSEDGVPERHLSVEGYDVFYAQNASSELQPVLNPGNGSNASGVIVVDEDRHIWTESIGSDDLRYVGEETVVVGGIGNRAEIVANRTAWEPVGNDSVYRIRLSHGGESITSFVAAEQRVDQRIDDHRIAIGATGEDGYYVAVTGPDGSTDREAVPSDGASVGIGSIDIVREDDILAARTNGTSVRIATSTNGA